jgi:hypothetical protein
VEYAFRILSNKWRILQRPLIVSPDFEFVNVKACVGPHALTVTGLEDVPDGQSVCGGLTANSIRIKVVDYFLTDAGAVPWQMSKI